MSITLRTRYSSVREEESKMKYRVKGRLIGIEARF